MKSILAKIDNIALNEVQIERVIEMAWEDRTRLMLYAFRFAWLKPM